MDNQEIIPKEFFADTTASTVVGGNPLCLPQHYPSSSYSKQLMAKSILHHFVEGNHDKIVFSSYVEGLNGFCMFYADDIAKILHNTYKVPLDKFIYLTGCFPTKSNLYYYKQHCMKYNLIEMEVIFLNTYEANASENAKKHYQLINSDPLTYSGKEKPFLCFNGVARPHRILMMGEIFARNLHPYTFLSCYDKNNIMDQAAQARWVVDQKMYGDRYYRAFYELERRKDLFPMRLSLPEDNLFSHNYTIEDHKLYSRSYISVVTETDFFQQYHSNHTVSLNCTFPTEKTFKPIKARHPFIIVSRPHFLKHLKQLGYKTFHPHINEFYDDIENDEKRMDAILTEMQRLAAYSQQEWGAFLYHINHICQYNFDLLINRCELTKQEVK